MRPILGSAGDKIASFSGRPEPSRPPATASFLSEAVTMREPVTYGQREEEHWAAIRTPPQNRAGWDARRTACRWGTGTDPGRSAGEGTPLRSRLALAVGAGR